jgi:hypothetical protein
MKTIQFPVLLLALSLLSRAAAAEANKDVRCYELRTYTAAPGKVDEMNARFRNHTCKLFEKHGMINVGYWMPLDNPEGKLLYLLAYPSREAREQSWKAFVADPDWQTAYQASEANGRLVAKAENVFLNVTDYSPEVKVGASAEPRVFELRTYTAAPGRLEALNARFRDHTVKLFQKHGITNVGYWTPMKDQKGADDTLIYLLAHPSKEQAAQAFDAFRQDPDWLAARKASEDKAGGSLTVPNGVKSEFLRATDYSPLR